MKKHVGRPEAPLHLPDEFRNNVEAVPDAAPIGLCENFPEIRFVGLKNRADQRQMVAFGEPCQNRDKKPVVYFEKVKKGMVLNKTNAKRIGKMHGEQMDNWSGKEIELYSELVPFQGEDVPSIRVRVEAPERPQREDFNAPLGGGDPNDPLGI